MRHGQAHRRQLAGNLPISRLVALGLAVKVRAIAFHPRRQRINPTAEISDGQPRALGRQRDAGKHPAQRQKRAIQLVHLHQRRRQAGKALAQPQQLGGQRPARLRAGVNALHQLAELTHRRRHHLPQRGKLTAQRGQAQLPLFLLREKPLLIRRQPAGHRIQPAGHVHHL